MSKKKAIIHSSKDPASLNIREKLFNYLDFEKKISNKLNNDYFINEDFLLYTTDRKQLYLDNIDKKLKEIEDISHVVFASRHSGEAGKKTFSVHTPGNPTKEAKYGGQGLSLSKSAPFAMKKSMKSLKRFNNKIGSDGFDVSLECTHHGPSEINLPCFFIEIGSSEKEWRNNEAGKIVARAIISLRNLVPKKMSFVSFGGGHYSPRQTRLLFETNVVFGHILPSYSLKETEIRSIINEAIEKTPQCGSVHLTSEVEEIKDFLTQIEKIDLPVYKEKEIRALNPLPPNKWKEITELKRDLEPKYFGSKGKDLSLEVFNKKLIEYVQKINREKLIESIKNHQLLYYKHKNGEISNLFLFPIDNLSEKRRSFIEDCRQIISEKRDIEIKEKSKRMLLDIIEKRFDPNKAKELGVSEREFGVLSDGENVEVSGNTITPAMVHNINKKRIEVSYCPNKKRIICIN